MELDTETFLRTCGVTAGPAEMRKNSLDAALETRWCIQLALLEFDKGPVNVRHIIDDHGRPYIELKQGDKKKFIKSSLNIVILGCGWNPVCYARILAGQHLHSTEMTLLGNLLKSETNVVFEDKRKNLLYYPFLNSPMYHLDAILETYTHRIDNTSVIEGALNGDKYRFANGANESNFSIFEEKEKYLGIFDWAMGIPSEERSSWQKIYNQDAGKELFYLLAFKDLITESVYYMKYHPEKTLMLRSQYQWQKDFLEIIPEKEAVETVLDTTFSNLKEAQALYKKLFCEILKDWVELKGLQDFVLPVRD